MVAHIAKRIVEFYVKNNAIELTADNIEVYQYGVEVGLSSLCNLLVVFVIGFVFQSLLANLTRKIAISAGGTASMMGTYQPKEPTALKKMKK